jgi:hypothetical protein
MMLSMCNKQMPVPHHTPVLKSTRTPSVRVPCTSMLSP